MNDLKILNARVPDYDADAFIFSDLLIDGGKIVKITAAGQMADEARETIDAAGQIAAPGFIDMHSHEDFPNENFFTSECCLRMGVTTKIAGNCGEMYDTLDRFVKRVNEGSPTNYMMFIGQNTLREMAGAEDIYSPANAEQIEKMQEIIRSWKQYGPAGLSCGFEYAPGVTIEETEELYRAFGDSSYMISVHFRSDGPKAAESTKELVEI